MSPLEVESVVCTSLTQREMTSDAPGLADSSSDETSAADET